MLDHGSNLNRTLDKIGQSQKKIKNIKKKEREKKREREKFTAHSFLVLLTAAFKFSNVS